MKVLITGGAGFIGSYLAERLIAAGCSVAVIDDLSTGSSKNVGSLVQNAGFSFVWQSVLNAPLVADLVESCDLVYHLAAAVGVRLVLEKPSQVVETNVKGTENVLRAAARWGTPVIIASTSEVYGKNASRPFREDADLVIGPPTRIRWGYACSKATQEILGMAYWRERGLPVTIVRLFNTVGPRQIGHYGMVVPTFVGQALRGDSITIHGSGLQTRCFSYVGEVVECLVRIGMHGSLAGEVINVGNDAEISINDLASLVKEAAGSSSEVVHVPYDTAYGDGFEDMAMRLPSLEKLERVIQFRPRMAIEEVVPLVVEDFRMRNCESLIRRPFATSR